MKVFETDCTSLTTRVLVFIRHKNDTRRNVQSSHQFIRFHALTVNNTQRGPLQLKQGLFETCTAQEEPPHIDEKFCPQSDD